MAVTVEYRGIQYSVELAGVRRWKVSPPDIVKVLEARAGGIEGERHDAVKPARAAIQDRSGA